jgi:GT2 family glycosyltransferase/glycosyltransferase involved in cell wall biosynthesis
MPLFDPDYYRAQLNIQGESVNSLVHFYYLGKHLGHSPSPWFDITYYITNNKDVLRSNWDPLLHYIKHGGNEGRSPCPHFDAVHYLKTYAAKEPLHLNPLLHYLYFGRQLGYKPLPESPLTSNRQSVNELNHKNWSSLKKIERNSGIAVDVIVPVYKGRLQTLECLFSVLSAKNDIGYELIVINDASPDKKLTLELNRLADEGFFTLLTNEDNLGFVQTVNRGMKLHEDRDIIILNADTEVYNNWLDRLFEAAYRNKKTATVTPLSNNATICSYPNFNRDNPYPLEISFSLLDKIASEVNSEINVEAPTGVGFCMFIKRDCLTQVGYFDEDAFGKGYGEENDFCQRAIQEGWRNIIATNVFVYHWGGCSFLNEKGKRIQHALKIIHRRYPQYEKQVKRFIKQDPLAEARRNLDWQRLIRLRKDKNILIINHNRGGGSERSVQEHIECFSKKGYGVFILRPHSFNNTLGILSQPNIKSLPNLYPVNLTANDTLTNLLIELKITGIHSHSFVDFTAKLPEHFVSAKNKLNIYWLAYLHDYKIICPMINLADDNGKYCGEPNEKNCNNCIKSRKSSFELKSIRQWRRMHAEVFSHIDRTIVPSNDVAKRLNRYFPQLNFDVVPHENFSIDHSVFTLRPVEREEKLRIVIIGAISKLKGFDIVLKCAALAKKFNHPLEFTILGYSMNDALMQKSGVHITGRYQDANALDKLLSLKPHVVWLPSLWPETYSYTLTIALQAGLPVFAFDIGAIAERLKSYQRDQYLIPLALAEKPALINSNFEQFRASKVVPAHNTLAKNSDCTLNI